MFNKAWRVVFEQWIFPGSPVLSCLALPVELENKAILTVEGLTVDGKADPLQAPSGPFRKLVVLVDDQGAAFAHECSGEPRRARESNQYRGISLGLVGVKVGTERYRAVSRRLP